MRGRYGGWLLACLLLGCGVPDPGLMVDVPPPGGWQERLLQFRRDKDALYGASPDSPLMADDRADFTGLEYWTPDPGYRLLGRLAVYPQPERFEIATTSGKLRPSEKYGWLQFDMDGRRHRLQVYRLLDSSGPDDELKLFLPFTDGTSGQETYPAGRYVDLVGSPGGIFELDFNRAYNPSCAYGAPERFVCPKAPAENDLALRVEAGERGYRE